MLVNVFYNPGVEGVKLEYGYRGTPTSIDLGFDASEDFHCYEIIWGPNSITWRVDGKTVHQRLQWDPTPVPNMPMELNVNLWNTSSEELAGRFDNTEGNATAALRRMCVEDYDQSVESICCVAHNT